MIYLQLFLTFLKGGIFAFGGGYAVLSLLGDSLIEYGWLTDNELMNLVGTVSIFPGSIAVNAAAYVGYEQGGILGAIFATAGVVLPSFALILIIASLIRNFLKYPIVKSFISGMRPAISGLIISVAITMGLAVFFGIDTMNNVNFTFDWRTIVILGVIITASIGWKLLKRKAISSILLIVLSGIMGILLYGI